MVDARAREQASECVCMCIYLIVWLPVKKFVVDVNPPIDHSISNVNNIVDGVRAMAQACMFGMRPISSDDEC